MNNSANKFFSAGKLLERMELPLCIATLAGLLLKLFHLPAANLLLVVALGTLTIVYFFNGMLLQKEEEISMAKKIILKIYHIGCSIGVTGILFFLLKWPNGKILILMSGAALLISLFYMLAFQNKNMFSGRMIYRGIAIAALEIFLFAVSCF